MNITEAINQIMNEGKFFLHETESGLFYKNTAGYLVNEIFPGKEIEYTIEKFYKKFPHEGWMLLNMH